MALSKRSCELVFLIFAFVGVHLLALASPFGDNAIEVKHSVISDNAQSSISYNLEKEPKITDIFSWFKWLGYKIEEGYNKLASTIKNRNKPGKLPKYISRAIFIPGHETAEMVFQGICHLPNIIEEVGDSEKLDTFYKYVILSYYPKKSKQPSQLIIVNTSNGKPIRRLALYQDEDTPYTGHAGGITTAGKYLWVSSGFRLRGFDLQTIIDFVNNDIEVVRENMEGLPKSFENLPATNLVMERSFDTDSSASFVSFDGEYLWSGDFVKSSNSSFAPIPHHGKTWISGYKVDSDGFPAAKYRYQFKTAKGSEKTGYKPDRILFCRESVQGFAVCGDYVALSISYGANASKLAFYKSPFNKAGKQFIYKPNTEKSYTATSWTINSNIHLKTVELPAGSEDLEFDDRILYVGFEGASPNYKPRWTTLRPNLKIEDRFYLIKPKLLFNQE